MLSLQLKQRESPFRPVPVTRIDQLHSMLVARRLRRFGQPHWTKVPGDVSMWIDLGIDISAHTYAGRLCPEWLWLIPKYARPDSVALDLGAFHGYCSLLLAKAVGPRGRVYAFEPDPWAIGALQQNVAGNNMQHRIRVVTRPLAENSFYGSLYVSLCHGNTSRFPSWRAKQLIAEMRPVKYESLDDLILNLTVPIDPARVSFIKMDIEGSEVAVLRGMVKFFARARPVIHLEVNFDTLEGAESNAQELEDILVSLGYQITLPVKGKLEPLPPFRNITFGPDVDLINVVCLPSGLKVE